MKSIPPPDPRDYDPDRFPWGTAIVFVLVLVALVFGGTRVVEAEWGLGAAVAYEITACVLWLLTAAGWLVFGMGRGKR
jgi:hypothetical protein